MNNDTNLGVLQIRSISVGLRLPSPTTGLFKIPVMGMIPGMGRTPITLTMMKTTLMCLKCVTMWHIGKFRFSGELVSFKELGQPDLIKVL